MSRAEIRWVGHHSSHPFWKPWLGFICLVALSSSCSCPRGWTAAWRQKVLGEPVLRVSGLYGNGYWLPPCHPPQCSRFRILGQEPLGCGAWTPSVLSVAAWVVCTPVSSAGWGPQVWWRSVPSLRPFRQSPGVARAGRGAPELGLALLLMCHWAPSRDSPKGGLLPLCWDRECQGAAAALLTLLWPGPGSGRAQIPLVPARK